MVEGRRHPVSSAKGNLSIWNELHWLLTIVRYDYICDSWHLTDGRWKLCKNIDEQLLFQGIVVTFLLNILSKTMPLLMVTIVTVIRQENPHGQRISHESKPPRRHLWCWKYFSLSNPCSWPHIMCHITMKWIWESYVSSQLLKIARASYKSTVTGEKPDIYFTV